MLPEDSIIMAALKSGDEQMFEQLFRHFYGSLCNYANSIINDTDEAEDVVQQTMIAIWEKRMSLQIATSLKSYLFRSVHNSTLNKIRQQKVRAAFAGDQQSVPEPGISTTTDTIHGNELEQQIQIAISQLPEQCRMVFRLSRFEGMKYSEIATHLGISVKTVENHMGRALRQLRVSLKDFLLWLTLIVNSIMF